MALSKPIGYICYNNSELLRDGYIEPVMAEVTDASDFNFNKLKTNKKGVSYELIKDDEGNVTQVKESRRLLPAEKLRLEIQFSKTLRNAVTSVIPPTAIPGSVGFLVGNPLAGLGFGGITSGYTDFTYHILDSVMKINEPVKITQQILDTGVIKFEDFPISIFGIVREYQETVIDGTAYLKDHPQARLNYDAGGSLMASIGLDFTKEQVERIGQHSRGVYQGGPRKRVDGATDDKGQFGEIGIPYLKMVRNQGDSENPPDQEVVFLGDQYNIFIEIIRDFRKTKFRGDNIDASGARFYPFENREVDDVTDHYIRISTTDLKLDDTIYITYCVSNKRRIRQAMRHKGIVGQGNTFGVTGWNLEIGSELDIFDFQIKDWIVPNKWPASIKSPDDEFKITYNQYLDWKQTEETFNKEIEASSTTTQKEILERDNKIFFETRFSSIEGWRMSSVISERLKFMWAADYRGILLMGSKVPAAVVLPYSQIRDKEWFTDYVKGLDFIEKHEDSDGNIIYDNLQIKIDDVYFRLEDFPEAPVDIGSPANEVLFDREKIPYYRPLAIALQDIAGFSEDDPYSGVGVISLDVALKGFIDAGVISPLPSDELYGGELIQSFENIQNAFLGETWRPLDLKFADLSLSEFLWTVSSPTGSIDCADNYPIKPFNYNCNTYNPGGGAGSSDIFASGASGPIWLTTSYIEDSLSEWRPPGGFIESYWLMNTPYFCGDFKKGTRIYIEKVGGNSLDNYSWIYVDTRPDVVDSISIDKDVQKEESYLTFYDNTVHNSLSYHVFSDSLMHDSFRYLNLDTNKNHSRTFLDSEGDDQKSIEISEDQVVIGYNNILGDSPSFCFGKPITNEISKIEHDGVSPFFEVDLLSYDYGLDSSDDIPKISNFPFNWAIKDIEMVYSTPSSVSISVKESYATVYFEDNNACVNNFTINKGVNSSGENLINIDCAYYGSETTQLLGEVWKKINIDTLEATVIDDFKLKDFKINESQSSVVSDGNGRVLVFFAESSSGNISVAVSTNNTESWDIYRDIIRLLSGEVATFPVALQDAKTSAIHLFYVLNSDYLMYERVDTRLFRIEDLWVEYNPPDYYDEFSLDDDPDNTFSSLYNFTPEGKALRQTTSHFVIGDSSSIYFKEQVEIANSIKEKNATTGTTQSVRFDFDGDEEQMDTAFNGKAFAVNIDNGGSLRLFYTEERGFSVKISPDFTVWDYVGRNLPLHKTYFSDTIKEEDIPIITNIQIARNYYNEDNIKIFYFYNNMLLTRTVPLSIFRPEYDSDGNLDEVKLRSSLEVKKEYLNSRPVFVVGNIPNSILDARISELSSATPDDEDSEISIIFPYPSNVLIKFDELMAVDVTTQVCGYTLRNGDVKVIYKDILGGLNGVWIQGDSVVPEIFYIVKKEII